MVIMYDGTVEDTMALAEEKGLNYPVLIDTTHELFNRWNELNKMPSTTMIRRGNVVHSIDQTWHTALIEELVYDYQ